jgi:hypothetical protein
MHSLEIIEDFFSNFVNFFVIVYLHPSVILSIVGKLTMFIEKKSSKTAFLHIFNLNVLIMFRTLEAGIKTLS